jgi:hypothetical protein
LSQKNITNFKGSNITQYLIFEWFDAIQNATLLADVKITSLTEPSDGVGLWMWSCRKVYPLEYLFQDEVLLAIAINDEVQWSSFHPHL